MELLTIAQAAKRLGVHPNSLRNWEKRGLIKPARLPGGRRRYSISELNKVLGNTSTDRAVAVLYSRVSTKKQADSGNIERQMLRLHQYAVDNGFIIREELSDVASGLNHNRRGLLKVFKLAECGEYTKLLIEYPDRLARFGYPYIERHLKYCGVEVIAIAEREPDDSHCELVKDLLSIVTSFSARLYGARDGKKVRDGFRHLITEVNSSGDQGETFVE